MAHDALMRAMKWRHDDVDSEEDVDTPTTTIGDECEAFLAGRFVPHRWPEGSATPVWAWLNEAAHGEAEHIAAVAAEDLTEETPVPERTRVLLARALVAAGPAAALPELQQRILVPLELELVGSIMTPRRLVELVGRALYS